MINPPEGAIKSIAELQELVTEARENETYIPIWRLYPITSVLKEAPTGLIKRQLTPLSVINPTRRTMRAYAGKSMIDVTVGAVGENPITSNVWYFTNYWMAWAHLQQTISKLETSK